MFASSRFTTPDIFWYSDGVPTETQDTMTCIVAHKKEESSACKADISFPGLSYLSDCDSSKVLSVLIN